MAFVPHAVPDPGAERVAARATRRRERRGSNLDDTANGVVRQRITVTYTPDDPHTAADEERVEAVAGGRTFGIVGTLPPSDPTYTPLNVDLAVGSPLRIGVTAATYSTTVPRIPVTFGAPVRVRASLAQQLPPIDPGGPRWTQGRPCLARTSAPA